MSDNAKDSFRHRAKSNRRKVKRLKAPDTDKMWGFHVPSMRLVGYRKTKKQRDETVKKYVDYEVELFNPVKS